MGERFLIDSSAAIKYLNNSFPLPANIFLDKEFDKEINISVIAKIEILAWNALAPDDFLIAEDFINKAFIFSIDERIGEIATSIRKSTKIKLPDILIAATAIAHDFTLVADNDKDFGKIVAMDIGLKYLKSFYDTIKEEYVLKQF